MALVVGKVVRRRHLRREFHEGLGLAAEDRSRGRHDAAAGLGGVFGVGREVTTGRPKGAAGLW